MPAVLPLLAGALLLSGCGVAAPSAPDTSVASPSSTTAPESSTSAPPPPAETTLTSTTPSASPTTTPATPTTPPPTTPPAQSPAPSPTTVDVLVTYADAAPGSGDLEVGGYAAVVEVAGACTLEATSGAKTVTAVIPATPDVSTTSCGGLTVDHAQVAGRTWLVRVTYDSPTSHGTSEPTEVAVP